MERKRKAIARGLLIILPFFWGMFTGCGHSYQKETFVRKEDLSGIKRLAVLPFYNLSDRVDAEVLVTNMVIGEIVTDQQYSTVTYGDIREFLLQERIQSTETISQETLRILHDRFMVDGVMLGTIITYREWNPNNDKEPAIVDLSARLLDCESGRIIWSGREKRTSWDNRKIFDIGEVVFCSQLVQKTVRDFIRELGGSNPAL